MKQINLDLNLSIKKTCKREFLFEMNRVVPWAALVELIAPYYPEGKNGRPPFALETMLRDLSERRACRLAGLSCECLISEKSWPH